MGAVNYEFEFDLDDPRRTLAHREIIRTKPFLRKVYISWYNELNSRKGLLPTGNILEIGSGGGFIKEIIPEVITSDILELQHCDMQFSAEEIPFKENSISSIFMINVLHHIPDPVKFFQEASRVLNENGMLIIVEPANTFFSRFIYKRFHHEPFDETGGWKLNGSGPMSDSNQAMPWIILHRDRQKFLNMFPDFKIESAKVHSPLQYILSGGVSRKNLVPDSFYSIVRVLEFVLSPFNAIIGMFQTTVIVKDLNKKAS